MIGLILDQSWWNGRCYFPTAKLAGAIGTFIRYGSINSSTGECYFDYIFKENVADAEQYGMPYGAYFYFRPKFIGVLQGNFFVSLLKQTNPKLPVMIDVEETGNYTNILDAVNIVRNAGYRVGIYSRQNIWDYNFPSNPLWSTLDLWAARWSSGLLSPWSDGRYKFRDWDNWKFWQFSADGNALATKFGFPGYPKGDNDIDLSYYNGTLESFKEEFLVAPDNAYIVTTSGLRIRSEPNTSGAIIGQRTLNEIVIPIDYGGTDFWVKDSKGWSAVNTGGSVHMKRVVS